LHGREFNQIITLFWVLEEFAGTWKFTQNLKQTEICTLNLSIIESEFFLNRFFVDHMQL
jgi:hypothetical protein